MSNFTVEQVRNELRTIVDREPDRVGSVETGYDWEDGPETSCVYFTDRDGVPVTYPAYDDFPVEDVELVTPVCLVGQWVHEFHPALKNDENFRNVLVRNAILGTVDPSEVPFDTEVLKYLGAVQSQQDGNRVTWGSLNLNPEV